MSPETPDRPAPDDVGREEEASPRVVIVDDEEMVTTSLRSLLELETSYRVTTVTDPGGALELVREERVHVLVADYLMPEMDGIELLRAVREARPETTRILLTGYADKENAIRAINEAGLYHYLEKPWENERLLMVVRNGVERSRLVHELEGRIRALEDAHEELYGIRRRLIEALL